eukprot:349823-Chlamydomonas_euryale.AAC.3
MGTGRLRKRGVVEVDEEGWESMGSGAIEEEEGGKRWFAAAALLTLTAASLTLGAWAAAARRRSIADPHKRWVEGRNCQIQQPNTYAERATEKLFTGDPTSLDIFIKRCCSGDVPAQAVVVWAQGLVDGGVNVRVQGPEDGGEVCLYAWVWAWGCRWDGGVVCLYTWVCGWGWRWDGGVGWMCVYLYVENQECTCVRVGLDACMLARTHACMQACMQACVLACSSASLHAFWLASTRVQVR